MSTDHGDRIAGAPLLSYCEGDKSRGVASQIVLAAWLD